ncbi:MAG: transporter [Ignavibacteriae bacterium]|nr:transporter [Ignavibacteriota bacterium]
MIINYRIHLFILSFLFFLPQFIFSQVSGRESEDDNYIYDIVEPKTLEIDADFYMEKYTFGSTSSGKQGKLGIQADLKYFNAPTLTFRYGIVKNLEFQLITGYTGILTNGTVKIKTKKNILISTTKDETGLNALSMGLKAGLLTNKNARPSIAFTGIITLPNIGNPAFAPNNVGAEMELNFYNLLSEKVDIAYNIGTIWSGYNDDPTNSYKYEISPGCTFSDNFGLYIDLSGIIQKGYSPDNRFDVDLSFYLNDNFTIDAFAGTSFNVKKFFFIGSTLTATIPF